MRWRWWSSSETDKKTPGTPDSHSVAIVHREVVDDAMSTHVEPLESDEPALQATTSDSLASNPLAGDTESELERKAESYCDDAGITQAEDVRAFRLGAILAGHPVKHATLDGLTGEERAALAQESSERWFTKLQSIPGKLWFVVIVCSLCAAVQGMDETTVNGAQIFYSKEFGLESLGLGFVNSAPYACCALLGCWLTQPLNRLFGRRGTVFVCCLISGAACIGQAMASDWKVLLAARIALGLGIGPKSATTPMYSAECAPPRLRGALTMQWQMWTAFGIMLGFAVDLGFLRVASETLKWRLMVGSTAVPAFVVCLLCFFCPESPRWYLSRGEHGKAYRSMCKIRKEKIQAARDLFLADAFLKADHLAQRRKSRGDFFRGFWQLVKIRRNRNAMVASEIVMIMQQFCGVNIIAYYSSHILYEANFPLDKAFWVSFGWGLCNFLGAIPALATIDKFGRRNLLLLTFPLMSFFLLFTGLCFLIPDQDAMLACIILGTYLFVLVYSPGAGPVPFTYSAEVYPLHVRPQGMTMATATTWFFNCLLALSFPILKTAATPMGAFGMYAAFNLLGFVATLFFVPETKGKSLEELDQVFSVPSKTFRAYGKAQAVAFLRRVVLRQDVTYPQPPRKELYLEDKETELNRIDEADDSRV